MPFQNLVLPQQEGASLPTITQPQIQERRPPSVKASISSLCIVAWCVLQPQLASGGYNCSKAPKMELAVTCKSCQLITARYICLLLWHFLISSCNQQQQLLGTTAAPMCSHYVTSSTKQQLQLSSYNCSQLCRLPQSSSYTC